MELSSCSTAAGMPVGGSAFSSSTLLLSPITLPKRVPHMAGAPSEKLCCDMSSCSISLPFSTCAPRQRYGYSARPLSAHAVLLLFPMASPNTVPHT